MHLTCYLPLSAWSPSARTCTVRFLLPSHAKQEYQYYVFRRALLAWGSTLFLLMFRSVDSQKKNVPVSSALHIPLPVHSDGV
jgi:hypothetical protein